MSSFFQNSHISVKVTTLFCHSAVCVFVREMSFRAIEEECCRVGGATTVLQYDYEKVLQDKDSECILRLAPIHKVKLSLDFDCQ